jgi:hypothetical protein
MERPTTLYARVQSVQRDWQDVHLQHARSLFCIGEHRPSARVAVDKVRAVWRGPII